MDSDVNAAGLWRPISRDEQEEIEEILAAASGILRMAGAETRDPRYPFVMHHSRCRSLISSGRKLRHSEVAGLLSGWAASRPGFVQRYAWQAAKGAAEHLGGPPMAALLDPHPAWSDGPGFIAWAKEAYGREAARETAR